jgi:hypothetical protein
MYSCESLTRFPRSVGSVEKVFEKPIERAMLTPA